MSKILNDLIEQKLYELMETSSFSELSDDEKEFVQEHFSKEEYIIQHKMMGELLVLEEEDYSDKVFNKSVIEPISKDSKVKQFFTYKIPSYFVAASLALAIVIPQLFSKKPQNNIKYAIHNSEFEEIVTKVKDSISVETKQLVKVEEEKTPSIVDTVQIIKLKQSIEATLEQPKGKTAKDDPYTIFYSS